MNDPTSSSKRTLFGIVWSCVSTVIICAWTSIHPNVPLTNKWKAGWNRLRLMFWMIIAPELVLAWAVRQLFAAKDIRDYYNSHHEGIPGWSRWTIAHGHLLGMGGYTLIDSDLKKANPEEQNGQVLTYDQLKTLIGNTGFEFPEIRTVDIEDRSKGDSLWKLIAILQTSWFIIQCIARGQQRLALTELELVTLALASLNAVTFAIWWYKPLGVQEPIRIYLKPEAQNEDIARQKNQHISRSYLQSVDLSLGDLINESWEFVKMFGNLILEFGQCPCNAFALFFGIPISVFYIISFPFFVLFPLGISFLVRILKTEPVTAQETLQSRGVLAAQIIAYLHKFRYSSTSAVSEFVVSNLEEIFHEFGDDGPAPLNVTVFFLYHWFFLFPLLFFLLLLFVLLLIPFFTFVFLISFVFTAVFGIVTTSDIQPGASHVPSFYASTTASDRWSRMVIFALFGAIFGGLHCIGWNFKFPTHSEQTVWRATSLAITVIPLIVAPIDFFLASRDINSYPKAVHRVLLFLDFITTVLLFVYVPARLSLLVQALVLLQHQPQSAFIAIDWTNYVPHIFS